MSSKRLKKGGGKTRKQHRVKCSPVRNNTGEMMKTAVEHHQAGRTDLAWELYQQVLQKGSMQQDALHLSGLIAQVRGDLRLAENLIRRAIESNPEIILFHKSLGSVLLEQGRYAEVEAILNKIITTDPDDSNAIRDLGLLLINTDRLDEAESCYQKIIHEFPADIDANNNLGVICKRKGKIKEAIDYFREAVRQKPDYAEASNNLGSCYADEGNLPEAIACFELAVSRKPDFAEAHNNLGVVFREKGEEEKAVSFFRKAVESSPEYDEACDNLGAMLTGLDKVSEGLGYIEKALEINPRSVDAQCNRGIALMKLEDLEAAESSSLKVLSVDPGKKEALNNLGLVYMKTGRMNEAIRYYQKAIDQDSQYEDAILNLANAFTWLGQLDGAFECFEKVSALNSKVASVHFNHSYALLLSGNYKQGWQEYEWRFKAKHNAVSRHTDITCWQGEELGDRTLLVYAEQGIGDEIRFANCIPDVIRQAKHVVIECDPRLEGLYQRSFPEASVFGVERDDLDWLSTAPPIDLQIAVGSLPLYTRTSLDDFPQQGGYLKADPERVAYWQKKLAALGSGPRVGIAWRTGTMSAERDLHNADFTKDWPKILEVPGIRFINMMYDECSEELEWARSELGVEIHDFSELDQFNDMEGVAALLSALDLLITVPVSVSEMAGALAMPSWYMIFSHHVNTLGSDHLPWFPHTRCFFKDRTEEWGPVTETLTQELTAFTKLF